MSTPTMDQAFDLMREIVQKYTEYAGPNDIDRHLLLVACTAEIIASKIPHLNGKKAYIFGLLHDYGKIINEKETNTFHGLTGYNLMNEKGFDEVAQICLTHSFTSPDFKIEDYSYNQESLAEAKKIMRNMVMTDYDYLIQLSDLLVKGIGFSNIKERMINISQNYGLSTSNAKSKYRKALILKNYFDELAGCNIYALLGVD